MEFVDVSYGILGSMHRVYDLDRINLGDIDALGSVNNGAQHQHQLQENEIKDKAHDEHEVVHLKVT